MKKLPNYLRAYRKRSGLSQEEVAYLLGAQTDSNVWLYEAGRRIPALPNLIAYERIFRTSGAHLYAGVSEVIEKRIQARAKRLSAALAGKSFTASRERKLKFLRVLLSDDAHAPHRL